MTIPYLITKSSVSYHISEIALFKSNKNEFITSSVQSDIQRACEIASASAFVPHDQLVLDIHHSDASHRYTQQLKPTDQSLILDLSYPA